MASFIHPLDFPQLWEKPSFTALLACLQALKLNPPTWNPKSKKSAQSSSCDNVQVLNRMQRQQHRRQVASYLTQIVSSPLSWIPSDEDKEVLWEEASRRLSERCGRSGMGEMTRHWSFTSPPLTERGTSHPEFTLAIREPPLTGDNLGLKTWCSSYVMAQKLPEIQGKHLSHLFPLDTNGRKPNSRKTMEKRPESSITTGTDSGYTSSGDADIASSPSQSLPSPPLILELGSGTGLLGLASAILFRTHVLLTDLPCPEIMSNLGHNCFSNLPLIKSHGGFVSYTPLAWGSSLGSSSSANIEGDADTDLEGLNSRSRFDLILSSDPLYDHNHPALLTKTIRRYLSPSAEARCVVMVPLRDEPTRRLLATFRTEMVAVVSAAKEDIPLVCMDEGIELGQDDWGDEEEEEEDNSEDSETDGMGSGSGNIECWWGVFKRDIERDRSSVGCK